MKLNYKVKSASTQLLILYLAMVIVCLYLTANSNMSVESILINVLLFAIVGRIFWLAKKRFSEIYKISNDLQDAANTIKNEYDSKGSLLWEYYESLKGNEIFYEPVLQQWYDDYIQESKRLKEHSDGKYSCSIEDYFNKNQLDVTAKKNMYNLVPGTMTGLGILGTFLGLSLGLRAFNTGSSAEISNSIAPLMDGIKVAFHTSIYGMLFSLIFNFIFKNVMDGAYDNLDYFLHVFETYVKSDVDSTNESNLRKMLLEMPEIMSQQIYKDLEPSLNKINATLEEFSEKTSNILVKMPEEIGQHILNTLEPAFNNMNITLETFSEKVSKSEMEGISNIVDTFLGEMNKSLGDNFTHLGETIEQTCELQKQNSDYMQSILSNIGDLTQNIQDVNELSEKTIIDLSEYVNRLESLQKVINENFMSINIQLESQNEMNDKINEYIKLLSEHQKLVSEATDKLSNDLEVQITNISKLEKDISENTKTNMEMLLDKAKEYSDSLSEVAKRHIEEIVNLSNNQVVDINSASQELSRAAQQLNSNLKDSLNTTFDSFDTNLADITKHLSGTISEVDATTERVPGVVVAAYDGMEKAFAEMQTKLETLVHSLDIMQRNLPRIVDKLDQNT